MRVFGLRTCDSCKKALAGLPGAVLVDIRATPLDDALLDRALAQFGTALVNTRSTTWRGLDDASRALPPRAQLRAHPALMKRPLIEAADGTLHLGWSDDVRAAVLAAGQAG